MDYEILTDIISSTSILSKIKLIALDLTIVSNKIRRSIYSWPNQIGYLKLSNTNRKYLQSMDIVPRKIFCNYYLIQHEQYENMKETMKKITHDEFEIMKDYFEILILKIMDQQKSEYKVEIKLANREEVDKELIPRNTSETDKLLDLRNNPDILITFKNSLTESKLPVFFSEIVFTKLGLFSSHSIDGLIDREKQSGKKSNKKHVQFRGVIEKKDMESYQKVSQISLSNMKKLISNSYLFSLIEKHHYEYEKYKQDDNYKKSLRY